MYAQALIGECYLLSDGVPEDYEAAAAWYRAAAASGHPGAQNQLGVMYEIGQGVPQSFTEAAAFYKEAANIRNPTATFNLAEL